MEKWKIRKINNKKHDNDTYLIQDLCISLNEKVSYIVAIHMLRGSNNNIYLKRKNIKEQVTMASYICIIRAPKKSTKQDTQNIIIIVIVIITMTISVLNLS